MINIEIITHNSNKTTQIEAIDNTYNVVNASNEIIILPYNSYCVYLSPYLQVVDYNFFLAWIHTTMGSILSIAFVMIIATLFLVLLRNAKEYFQ